MNIRFTSSLTPDDENAVAPALLKALANLLDLLPIAYAIRIDTTDSHVYQHVGRPAVAQPAPQPTRPRRVAKAGNTDTSH